MAHINIDGAQNVEVSKPIPSQKSPQEQLEIMEAYTRAHKNGANLDKAFREIHCLKVLFPRLFRTLEPGDQIAGRLDFLPIGFGSVTSIGGVGHYCVFHKLRAFKSLLKTEEEKARVDALYDYWQYHDVKSIYCQDVLTEDTTGRFIDCKYPFMATARLSGMMLDYQKLMRLGVNGLIEEIQRQDLTKPFIQASLEAMKLFQTVISYQIDLVKEAKKKQVLIGNRIWM